VVFYCVTHGGSCLVGGFVGDLVFWPLAFGLSLLC
jgi:hypothetical protein